ncbi:melanocyte-stimulating hormone receptor-like [Hydractinia symbiolongicarpus]|uniref:melanocyte-stimulating hormone receptor-like n=1 Tax=Hydractinia symbiolongicarpus TaxID=13093 RepID=UPI00254EEEB9|nr:melanocyte-stimulating hormone receptor-like [Hydractinia symbiolongicarpus]
MSHSGYVYWTYFVWLECFLILAFNGLAISAVLRNGNLRRQTVNIYLLCLLSTHFMLGLWGMTEAVLFSATQKHSSEYKPTAARRISTMLYISIQCCTFSALVLVTMDRYIAVHRPLSYQKLSARFIVGSIIIAVIPAAFFGGISVLTELSRLVSALFCAVTFIGGLFVTFVNVTAYLVARRHFRNIMKNCVGNGCGSSNVANSLILQRRQRSLIVTLVLVLTFFIAWTPSFVNLAVAATGRKISRSTVVVSFALLLFNSCVDPLVYALLNVGLRRELMKMVRVWKHKVSPLHAKETKNAQPTGSVQLE